MHRQLFKYHPTIGYKFIPHLKARNLHESGGYLIQTNNVGFRDHKDLSPEYEGKRVFWFGDSFTAGDGVSNGKRFTDLLDRRTEAVDIFNFGLSGSGTDQQYLIYKEIAAQYPCDLIVVTVLVENIRRVNAHYRFFMNGNEEMMCYQKPYFQLDEQSQLQLRQVPVDKRQFKAEELGAEEQGHIDKGGRFYQLRRVLQHKKIKEVAQKVSRFQPVPEYNSPDSKEWLLMKAILEKWAAEAKCPFLVIPLPLYQHLEGTADARPYQQRFQELKGVKNLTVYDPLTELQTLSLAERRKFRFEKDIHLTPFGHAKLAEVLEKPVMGLIARSNIPLPPSKGEY